MMLHKEVSHESKDKYAGYAKKEQSKWLFFLSIQYFDEMALNR